MGERFILHGLCVAVWVVGVAPANAGEEPGAAPGAPTVGTQPPTREQRIAQWLSKTRWPNTSEVMRIHNAEVPRMYLAGVGRTEKLGPGWGPGNQYWELAHAAVIEAVRAEELHNGPLLPQDAHAYAKLVHALNFTDEDIAFLDRLATTPYGRAYVDVMDHMMAAMGIKQLSAEPNITEETKLRLRGLSPRLKDEMSAVVDRLAEAKEKQKADEDQLETVLGRIGTGNNMLFFAEVMRDTFSQASRRLTGALFRLDLMSTIRGQVRAFRASEPPLPASGKSGS